jgi:hypothetical protein
LLLLGSATESLAQKGRPSFSGGSTRSFSSGSSSRPSFSGGSKPSISGSSSKPSFSGGSSSGSNSSKSSGASSRPSFTSTKTTTPIAGKEPSSVSKKPAAPSFDSVARTESKKESSRISYERSETPAPTYKSPTGREIKLDPTDKESKNVRSKMTEDHWVRREEREKSFYAPYASRPIVAYNDPYHPLLTYWILSQSIENQALWMYHHQAMMDSGRTFYIYQQNAELKAKVEALKNTPQDSSWTPSGADPDLLYHDNYVNANFNPKPKEVTTYEYDSSAGRILLQIFVVIVSLILIAALMFGIYYLIFEKKFNF